jgi:hypothetical protein
MRPRKKVKNLSPGKYLTVACGGSRDGKVLSHVSMILDVVALRRGAVPRSVTTRIKPNQQT